MLYASLVGDLFDSVKIRLEEKTSEKQGEMKKIIEERISNL